MSLWANYNLIWGWQHLELSHGTRGWASQVQSEVRPLLDPCSGCLCTSVMVLLTAKCGKYICVLTMKMQLFSGVFSYVRFGLDPLNANLCLNLISQELQLGLSLSCSCFWITSVPYRSQGNMGRFSVVVCLRGGKTGLWQVADARAVCRNKETWGSRLLWLWFSTKQNRAMAFSIYWGRGVNTIKMEIAWVLEMLFEIVMSGK